MLDQRAADFVMLCWPSLPAACTVACTARRWSCGTTRRSGRARSTSDTLSACPRVRAYRSCAAVLLHLCASPSIPAQCLAAGTPVTGCAGLLWLRLRLCCPSVRLPSQPRRPLLSPSPPFVLLPAVKAWVRYAKFEMKSGGDVAAARSCYERAVEELGEDANNEELFLRFAEFEERVKEVDRARCVGWAALHWRWWWHAAQRGVKRQRRVQLQGHRWAACCCCLPACHVLCADAGLITAIPAPHSPPSPLPAAPSTSMLWTTCPRARRGSCTAALCSLRSSWATARE